MPSSITFLPQVAYEHILMLKEKVDTSMGWNWAIQEALNDPETNEFMQKYNLKRKDIRDLLSGRCSFECQPGTA